MSVLNTEDVKNDKLNSSGLNLTKTPVKEIAPLNVTHLDLSNNKIASTDNVFTSLPGLVRLDLSGNRIKSVCGDMDIGLLQKLADLSLANNEIQGVCKQMRHLSLNDNPLKLDLAEVVGPSQNNAQCRTAAANAIQYLKGGYQELGDKNKKCKVSCIYPQNKKSRNKTKKNSVFEFLTLNILCIISFVVLTDVFLYALYEESYGSVSAKIFCTLTSASSNFFHKTCIEVPVKSYKWIVANPFVQQYFENVLDSWQSL